MKQLVLSFLLSLMAGFPVAAELLVHPEKHFKENFPEAKVTQNNLLLDQKELKKVRSLAEHKVGERIYKYYEIKRSQKPELYAFLLTREVRTKNATALILIHPQGHIKRVVIVAFDEPPDYKPGEQWLKNFKGASSGLQPGKTIPNISGATLSAEALSKACRTALSVWRVKLATESKQ